MSDVEGVRNLIGTGLVEFVGGMMTAVIALVYLIHTSVTMTGVAFAILLVFGYGITKPLRRFARFSGHGRKSTRKSQGASPNRSAAFGW